jgi:hypothetical protein
MKTLGASRRWAIGTTVVFGIAQIWAAYHLSSRLQGYGQMGSDWLRWLLLGAVLLMVAGELLTAASGTRER